MRIHISQTTHTELMKAGIYHMEKRGSITVKVKQAHLFLSTRIQHQFGEHKSATQCLRLKLFASQ